MLIFAKLCMYSIVAYETMRLTRIFQTNVINFKMSISFKTYHNSVACSWLNSRLLVMQHYVAIVIVIVCHIMLLLQWELECWGITCCGRVMVCAGQIVCSNEEVRGSQQPMRWNQSWDLHFWAGNDVWWHDWLMQKALTFMLYKRIL